MISVGKYAAAAKGGRNVASDVTATASTATREGSGRAGGNAGAVSSRTPRAQRGNMAGYRGGGRADIRMEGAGYGHTNTPRTRMGTRSAPTPYQPNLPARSRVSDYTRSDYHGLTADRDLSRLI